MLWFGLVLAIALPRIAVSITPRLLANEGAVRLECRVARHPDNRRLEFGLVDVSSSQRELNGEAAQVVWQQIIRVPCGEWTAYCVITDALGTQHWARAQVQAACAG